MRIICIAVFCIAIFCIISVNTAVSTESGYSDFEAEKPLIIEEINKNIPKKNSVTYTEVPRGIILSIAQEEFFDNNSDKISKNGKILLAHIASLLDKFNNNCTIEAHSEELLTPDNIYRDDWEISIVRATKIAEYLSENFQIKNGRLFPVGFGKIMPFRGNVAPKEFFDNRIDFVIFDYSVTR